MRPGITILAGQTEFRKSWFAPLGRVRRPQSELIPQDLLQHARREIRKLGQLRPLFVSHKAALLEHPPGCAVVRMTKSVEQCEVRLPRHIDHRLESLRRVALSPRVLGEHISRHGPIWSLESQACPAEQTAIVARADQVRSCRPALPLGGAEREKRLSVRDGLMPRPPEESRHLAIAGVALEYFGRIVKRRLDEQQTRRGDLVWGLQNLTASDTLTPD